jgi:Spy/CpxP family protein refolding chaperone
MTGAAVRRLGALALTAAVWAAPPAFAQQRAAQPAPPGGGVSPAELQRLFDAYVIMQAQDDLSLDDEQYPRFLGRVKVLQDARRRADMERRRIVQELRRLTQPRAATFDEARVKERLKALDDLNLRSATEIQQAQASLDEVLTLRQQARFRIFEEMMEQRKVDLLMRARQQNRPRAGTADPQP